jgi:hypothetical protein
LPPNVQLQLDEETAQGVFSNLQILSSNDSEFVLDFAFLQPQAPRGKVRARVILTPRHAKGLLHLLAERVRDHEARHGHISMPSPVTGKGDGGLPN